MKRADEVKWERVAAALREQMTHLSEAILRINESLDMETVLQVALDKARALTGARYGVMSIVDEAGGLEELLASNLTPEEFHGLQEIRGGLDFFEHLRGLRGPLRVEDLSEYARGLGLSGFDLAVPARAFLTAPVRRGDDNLGFLYVAKSETGHMFSQENEETLSLFATHAALVIANARRHREERRARASLGTLVDTSPVGVVLLDPRTGAMELVNQEAKRIAKELREQEQSMEELMEVMRVRRDNGHEFALAEIPMQPRESVRVEEIVLEVPGGKSITVLMNATPIAVEKGEVESFVVTLQDMTPLQEQERMRADFLAMVSHGLRTPLSAIRGSVGKVLNAGQEMDPGEQRQYHDIIAEQVDSMEEMIGHLLDMTLIRSGNLPINPEPADVSKILGRANSTFLSGGGRSSLNIEVEPDLPLVMADQRRIVQVVGELLSNADLNSPDSSVIRVAAARQGAYVAVAVAYEGRGIPSEQAPDWVEEFPRRERLGGDFGLGLVICKGIVEAHGGRIRQESAGVDLGARFTFTLPAAEESLAERPSPPSQARHDAGGECILAVDYDQTTLRRVREALAKAGYNPIVTTNPAEARRMMKEKRPSLVLLDSVMPDIDGIELMKQLFGIARVPVIFLSAFTHERMVARALDEGAFDYIEKRIQPTELVARVGAALRWQDELYGAEARTPYVQGDLTIDYNARLVTLGGRRLHLTPVEYNLLQALSIEAGRVVTHRQLMQQMGKGYIRMGSIRTAVRRLRGKLGEEADNPRYIFAERGVGYRMARGETKEAEG